MLDKNNQKKLSRPGKQKNAETISTEASGKINRDAEKKSFLDITALIRSIQRADGQTDCFQKGMIDCDQLDCKWRPFCLEGQLILGED